MASPRNLIVEAYNSLSRDINKLPGRSTLETQQGVVSEKLPEISVDTDNGDLLKVLNKYEKSWVESAAYAEWIKRTDENENYWKGKHFQRPETDKTRALVDNVIFEAIETSLPQYISRNPEPDVELKRSEIGANGEPTNPIATVYVDEMQAELSDLGDDIKLRAKMKRVARFWLLNLVGIGKAGWDLRNDRPALKAVRPRKIILDPDAANDEDGYTGEIIGEYRKLSAHKMIPFLTEEGAKEAIMSLVKDNLATKVQFIEWWTDTTLIWSLGGKQILLKLKNPHWNWDEKMEVDSDSDFTPVGIAPEGSPAVPQLPSASEAPNRNAPGKPTMPKLNGLGNEGGGSNDTGVDNTGTPPSSAPSRDQAVGADKEEEGPLGQDEEEEPVLPPKRRLGINHLPAPTKPYFFIVMFTLLDQPVDNTSLITQNLANQDLINKRNKQIDKYADTTNNGLVVSLERSGLTSQESKGVTEALRKGGVVAIPAGAPQDAIYRPPTPDMPDFIYEHLQDVRARVRGIMGVQGSSAAGLEPDNTVRGKIMNRTLDTDRIGGGISEVLEQFADDFYNYAVQLKLVYEDKYASLASQGALPKIRVTIKQGSLLPKDKVTLANQATDLAAKGQMSKLDLYKALEYPNAEEMAVNAWLEVNAPDLLYKDDPRIQAAVQRSAQAAQAELEAKHGDKSAGMPTMSMKYEDLPPDGKVQMAAKVGINLHPEGVAAHDHRPNQEGEPPVEAVPGMSPGNV